MKRVVILWILGAGTVGVALGTAEQVAACECAVIPDSEKVANADAIFTGTLVDTSTSAYPERFVFEVDEVFKGDVFARQSIVTDGSTCALQISGPGPFVVFARTNQGAVDGELYSNSCSGTYPANGLLPAGIAIGSPPRPGASAIGGAGTAAGDGGTPTAVWMAVACGVLAALALCGLAAHRRSRSVT